jgi:AcrR family transcriptional regulator
MDPFKPSRLRGRPRRADVEDRVLGATVELLTERGVEATTMHAVIERSGVARASVYLRWPNRQALITAAGRRAMGRPVITPSGGVEDDLRRAAEQARAMFSAPAFHGVFPALVAAVTRPGPERISFDTLAPGRPAIIAQYEALAASQGFRDDIAGAVVADLIIGSGMAHFLMTGDAPTAEETEQILSVVFDGLRCRTGEPG